MAIKQPEAEGWKFREMNEGTFATIINKELWLANPSSFNDPFDCDLDIAAIFDELGPYLQDELSNGIRILIIGLNKYLAKTYGYLCLCESWSETLMWSHYANEHQGIALGFNFKKNGEGFKPEKLARFKVEYDDTLFKETIIIYQHTLLSIYEKLRNGGEAFRQDTVTVHKLESRLYHLLRKLKAACWQYEKEIRYEIELKNGSPGVARSFMPSELEHVIFGLKCSERNILTMQNLLKGEEWKHVQLWQAIRVGSSLTVHAERIER